MTTAQQVFTVFGEDGISSGVAFKNKALKKAIVTQIDQSGASTIAELSRELAISTPKITSLVNELVDDGLLQDEGKMNSTGGRRASVYGLVSTSGYFIGVDVKRFSLNIGLLDFKKTLVATKEQIPYKLENTKESLQALLTRH